VVNGGNDAKEYVGPPAASGGKFTVSPLAAFKAQYATRAGIESTLSQGVRAFGLRRSRYIGLAKTHLQHRLIAVGINLKRIMAWFTHPQPTKPYVAPFAALVSSG
jgi:transposase